RPRSRVPACLVPPSSPVPPRCPGCRTGSFGTVSALPKPCRNCAVGRPLAMTPDHTVPGRRRVDSWPATAVALVTVALVTVSVLMLHDPDPARADRADAAGPVAPPTCAPA